MRAPVLDGVDLAVESDVAAVGVVEDVLVQQRAIQRGVERLDVSSELASSGPSESASFQRSSPSTRTSSKSNPGPPAIMFAAAPSIETYETAIFVCSVMPSGEGEVRSGTRG